MDKWLRYAAVTIAATLALAICAYVWGVQTTVFGATLGGVAGSLPGLVARMGRKARA